MVSVLAELRIIDDKTFDKAQEILKGGAFNITHERQSNKDLFSTLTKCKDCGWSFRKQSILIEICALGMFWAQWKRGRELSKSAAVDEKELIDVLQDYFKEILAHKKKVVEHVV